MMPRSTEPVDSDLYRASTRVPVPDPTLLTTSQLNREINNARELIESKVNGAITMLEGKIANAIAADEISRTLTDRHTDIAVRDLKEVLETRLKEIGHLESLVRGWVDSLQILIETQLKGAVATINTRLDGNDTALVAALKAQKEEAAKQTENFKEVLNESKKGTEKQIDSLNEKIDDLKERFGVSSGRSLASGNIATLAISGIAALASLVTAVIVILKSADGIPLTK